MSRGVATKRAVDLALTLLVRDVNGDAGKRAVALTRERLALLEADSFRGLGLFHGAHCAMRGGPYPSNPAECSDAQCREWAERVTS